MALFTGHRLTIFCEPPRPSLRWRLNLPVDADNGEIRGADHARDHWEIRLLDDSVAPSRARQEIRRGLW